MQIAWDSELMITVWSLLGSLLGTLLLVAGSLWASAQVIAQARRVWGAVRGHVPDVLAAVDEPGDALTARLGQVTQVPAAVWAAFLPAFIEALAAGPDRALVAGDGPGDPAE